MLAPHAATGWSNKSCRIRCVVPDFQLLTAVSLQFELSPIQQRLPYILLSSVVGVNGNWWRCDLACVTGMLYG
jgi:hypothetical protein